MNAAVKESETRKIQSEAVDHELRLQQSLVDALREELEQGPLSERAARLRVQLTEETARLDLMRKKKPGLRKIG